MPANSSNEKPENPSSTDAESKWGFWRRRDQPSSSEDETKTESSEKSLKEVLSEFQSGPKHLTEEPKAETNKKEETQSTGELAPLPQRADHDASQKEVKDQPHDKNLTNTKSTSPNKTTMNDEPTDNVSAQLSAEDKREIKEAIATIRKKLNFVDINESEREDLMRLGKTGRNFVEKALGLSKASPGILPRSFNEEEFRRDAELFCEMGEIADDLKELSQQVSDNEAAVGSDAFTAALVVYQHGKLARKGDEMDGHLRGLKRRITDDIREKLD